MMNLKQNCFLALLVCLLGSTLLANGGTDRVGDLSWEHSRILGFSPDGRFVAFLFERYAHGAAVPNTRTVHVIDVDKNDYVRRPLTQASKAPFPGITDSGLIALADTGGRWGIDAAIKGEEAQLKRTAYGPYQFATFQTDSGTLDVRLETKPAGEFYESRHLDMFELVLMSGDRIKVLQSDARLPKSRQSAADYGIKSVYLYRDKLAVFVGYINLKEGRWRELLVTGTLDLGGQ